MAQVRGIKAIHGYSVTNPVKSLADVLRETKPDIVIPCDERAVAQLHELHAKCAEWRVLIDASLGDPRWFTTVRSREGLMDVARECGLLIPETRAIRSEADLQSWFADFPGRAVMKLDGSWGGNGVEFVASYGEAVNIFDRMCRRMSFGKAAKRFLIDRDRVAIWECYGPPPSISIQTFIPGQPANSMLACWKGELLGQVSVEALETQGRRGAATVVRVMEHGEIRHAASRLTSRLGLSGFHGLDFILEEGTRRAYLIELNPRCTQLGHLSLAGMGDLAGILHSQLTGAPAPPPTANAISDTIAFFPQALAWNPDCPFLRAGYHDVPWEDPRLIVELLKVPWPERQWRARLYAFVCGRKRNLDSAILGGAQVGLTKTTHPSRPA